MENDIMSYFKNNESQMLALKIRNFIVFLKDPRIQE